MKRYLCVLTTAFAGLSTGPCLFSQLPGPPNWTVGPLKLSGLLDVYGNYTPNHPASRTLPFRNFDIRTDGLSLNMGKFTVEHDPAPVGFKLDFGFGRAFDLFNFQDHASGFDSLRYLPQAYLSLRPANGKGLQIDIGKFYTSAGAELTETHLGWNYSRGLLYTNGPYYHFGVRAAKPVNSRWTAGVQLVNGWNNVEDTNGGKTVGLTSALSLGKVSWLVNYYGGSEPVPEANGMRHFVDQVVTFNPTERIQTYLNVDYGHQRLAGDGNRAQWAAVGAAARFQLSANWAVSPRLEYFKDLDGFMTGNPQGLKAFTFTVERKWQEGLIARTEYRHDWSSHPIFERGATLNARKHGDTFVIGMMAFFGPKP